MSAQRADSAESSGEDNDIPMSRHYHRSPQAWRADIIKHMSLRKENIIKHFLSLKEERYKREDEQDMRREELRRRRERDETSDALLKYALDTAFYDEEEFDETPHHRQH